MNNEPVLYQNSRCSIVPLGVDVTDKYMFSFYMKTVRDLTADELIAASALIGAMMARNDASREGETNGDKDSLRKD